MKSSLTVCVFNPRDHPNKCKNSKTFKFRVNGYSLHIVVFREILNKEDVSSQTSCIPTDIIKLPDFLFKPEDIYLIPKFTPINGNRFLHVFGETSYINSICCIHPCNEYSAAALTVLRSIEGFKFLKVFTPSNVRFANLNINKFGKHCKVCKTGGFYTYFFDDVDIAKQFDSMNFQLFDEEELTVTEFFTEPSYVLSCNKQTSRSLGIKSVLRIGNSFLVPPDVDIGKSKAISAQDITIKTTTFPPELPTEYIKPAFEFCGPVLFISSSHAGHSVTYQFAEGYIHASELFSNTLCNSPSLDANRPPKLSGISSPKKFGENQIKPIPLNGIRDGFSSQNFDFGSGIPEESSSNQSLHLGNDNNGMGKMIPLEQASERSFGFGSLQKLPLNETPFGMGGNEGMIKNNSLDQMQNQKPLPFNMSKQQNGFKGIPSKNLMSFSIDEGDQNGFSVLQKKEGSLPFSEFSKMKQNEQTSGFEPIPFGTDQNNQPQNQNKNDEFEYKPKPNPFKVNALPFANEMEEEQQLPLNQYSMSNGVLQGASNNIALGHAPGELSPRPGEDNVPGQFSPRPTLDNQDIGLAQSSGFGQENGFNQNRGFNQSGGFGQENGFNQNGGFNQSGGFGQGNGFNQNRGFGQGNGFNQNGGFGQGIQPGQFSPRPDQEIQPGQYSPRPGDNDQEVPVGQYSPRPGDENGIPFNHGNGMKPQSLTNKQLPFAGNMQHEIPFSNGQKGFGHIGSQPASFVPPFGNGLQNRMNEGMQFGGGMGGEQPFDGGIPLSSMKFGNDQPLKSPFANDQPMRSPFGGSPFMDDPSFSSSPFRERSPFGFTDGSPFGSGRRDPISVQMHQPKLASIPGLSPLPDIGSQQGGIKSQSSNKLGTTNSNQIIIANLAGNVTPGALKSLIDVENIKYTDELEPLCSNNTIAYVINTFGINIGELERKVNSISNMFNLSRPILKDVDKTIDDAVEEIISEWQSVKYIVANIRPEITASQFKLFLRHAKSVTEDASLGTLISNETKAFIVVFNGLETNYTYEIDALSDKIFLGAKYYEMVTGKVESSVNSIFKAIFVKEQKRVSRWVIGGLKKSVTALEVKINLKNTEAVIPSTMLQPLCQPPNQAFIVYISARAADAASDIAGLPLYNSKPLYAEIQKGNVQNAIDAIIRSEKKDLERKPQHHYSSDNEEADVSEEEEPNYIKFLLANLPPECTNEYIRKKLPSVVKITTDPGLDRLNRGMRHACIANFATKDCKNELKDFCKGKYGKMHPKITLIKDSIEDAVAKIQDYRANTRHNWLTVPLERIKITKSDTYKDREAAVLALAPEVVPQYVIIHQKYVYIDYNSEEKCNRASKIING